MAVSKIERIASNTPWEPVFGYVRKVKAGDWLAVSGTTATDDRGMIVGVGQMYVQARQALLNLKHHIESSGFSMDGVVRTRVFVTDLSRFAEVAKAHQEVMGEFPPASTCVEVRRLVHPDMLIEIEADVFGGTDLPMHFEKPTAKTKVLIPKKGSKRDPKRKSAIASRRSRERR